MLPAIVFSDEGSESRLEAVIAGGRLARIDRGTPMIWAGIVTPSLTTVRQPISAPGVEAVRALVGRIGNPERRAYRVKLPVSLVVRESTREVPNAE